MKEINKWRASLCSCRKTQYCLELEIVILFLISNSTCSLNKLTCILNLIYSSIDQFLIYKMGKIIKGFCEDLMGC